MKPTALLTCLGLACFATYASAQILPADRTTVWHPGVPGGVPNRTTVCAVVNASTYGNGASDASSGIQAAVNACPVGQVVQLSAGTFTVNNYILINKGITLRGAGPTATVLQKTNGAIAGVDHGATDNQPIVVVGPNRWPKPNDATSQSLVANGARGATSVAVANSAGFAAGQFVLVDANEYNAAGWTSLPTRNGAPTSVTIWSSDRAVFMRHNPTDSIIDDPFPSSLTWFSRSGRPINEVKRIASVSGNVITFTTPLHIDYPTAKASQVTRYQDVHVQNAGVESLKMIRGSDGTMRFEVAAFCWVKNVEITVWEGEGVAINNAFGVEVRDSYIHEAAYSTPGGGAYAISFANASSETLIENNIVMTANKVMVARSAGAGSVVAYTYMDDGLIQYDLTWNEVGINASHMVGSHHVLFEGNESFNYDSDNTHGNAIYMTVLRNHLSGFRRDYPGTSNARTAGLNYGSWWHSFVGNVLGVSGAMTGWGYENSFPWNSKYIWELGYQSGQWDQAADPKVLSTVLRGGNFDYVTNTVHWESIAPQAIPNSLYLSAKPAFFGTYVWPWVDPTGPVKLSTLPAKARFDAGTPFAPPPGSPPTVPTGLRIVRG